MKINDRKKKIESAKTIKELVMYTALLSSGRVYMPELDFEEEKERSIWLSKPWRLLHQRLDRQDDE